MNKKRKRGVSPLIATVLIIGFVVALGAVVMTWGSGMIEAMKSGVEKESEIKITCTKMSLDVRSACVLGNEVKLLIENLANKGINSFIFRVKGNRKSSTNTSSKGLGVAGIGNFRAGFDATTGTGVGFPQEINIFPRILIDEELATCDYVTRELRSCYKLPRLDVASDWTFDIVGEGAIWLAEIIEINDWIGKLTELNLTEEQIGLLLGSGYVAIIATNETGISYSVELRSAYFVIPEDTNNIHFMAIYNVEDSGSVSYDLKYVDGSIAKNLHNDIANSGIVKLDNPYAIEELKGQEVYFSLNLTGETEYEYATLSEFCYTETGSACVI